MAVVWRYTPPRANAIPVIAAASKSAEHAAAEELLAKSRQNVPVDSGRLRDSGQVIDTDDGAVVGYGFDDAEVIGFDENDLAVGNAPTSAYAVKQHEDLQLHHDNGNAKWLENAMHSERDAIAAVLAETVRKAL